MQPISKNHICVCVELTMVLPNDSSVITLLTRLIGFSLNIYCKVTLFVLYFQNQLLNYRSTISNHGSKIEGLERELTDLNQEFETLQEKVTCQVHLTLGFFLLSKYFYLSSLTYFVANPFVFHIGSSKFQKSTNIIQQC